MDENDGRKELLLQLEAKQAAMAALMMANNEVPTCMPGLLEVYDHILSVLASQKQRRRPHINTVRRTNLLTN